MLQNKIIREIMAAVLSTYANSCDGWLLALITPVTGLWRQWTLTLRAYISLLTGDLLLIFSVSYVMDFHVPTMSLCVSRCGTTLSPRQPRTGLTSACGSTGHLTSSGSWVKTSPSGQDGKRPLTPLPLPNICCSSQGWLPLSLQSWSLPCSSLLLSLKIFVHCDPVAAWGMLLWPSK